MLVCLCFTIVPVADPELTLVDKSINQSLPFPVLRMLARCPYWITVSSTNGSRAAPLPNGFLLHFNIPYHTIPYHTIPSGPPWPRFATTSAEANSGWSNAHALPEWKGIVGSASRCRWCVATATFYWQCVCVVCAKEKERRLKGFCLLLHAQACMLGFCEAVHCL